MVLLDGCQWQMGRNNTIVDERHVCIGVCFESIFFQSSKSNVRLQGAGMVIFLILMFHAAMTSAQVVPHKPSLLNL